MSPPSSQFVSSCMLLIFTICAFTRLELVASRNETTDINHVCRNATLSQMTHDECINILKSDPRSSNATTYTQIGLIVADMTISKVTEGRDRIIRLIGMRRDPDNARILSWCTSYNYDDLVRGVRYAYEDEDPLRQALFSKRCVGYCQYEIETSHSEYKDELLKINTGIKDFMELFLICTHYYDRDMGGDDIDSIPYLH